MKTLAHLWRLIKGDIAVGETDRVGQVFLACRVCSSVVPQWSVLQVRGASERVGCRCGSQEVRPARIPEWKAALWMAYGAMVRRAILRKDVWDPRIPWQKHKIG